VAKAPTIDAVFSRERADGLAQYVSGAIDHPLDEATAEAARRGMLDWVGVALAGSREPAGRIAGDLHEELGGTPQSSLVGRRAKTSPPQAALVNGTAGHALDFDDTHMHAAVHGTATVLPAALAVAEAQGASSLSLLRAYATGFEVTAYLGKLVYPVHFEAAWHASAMFGTVGAAGAASLLLRLRHDEMANALSLAATQAAGLREMFGTMAKPFHAGKAASNGVLSALLAARGFDAARDGFWGRRGFFRHLGARRPEDYADLPAPTYWSRIRENDFKLYSCCHATHPSVDAALAIRAQRAAAAEEVAAVHVRCDPVVSTVAADPDPTTGLAAKFSVAYCVLTALLEGDAGVDRFTDAFVRASPARGLLPQVTVEFVPGRGVTTADVEVTFRDGQSLRAAVDTPRGSSTDPASWDELAAKFRSLAAPVIGAARADALEDGIRSLPRTTVPELVSLLQA
jgi:2-methylcitrate dehydratase PrpD